MNPHAECVLAAPCAAGAPATCPVEEARVRRQCAEAGAWSQLVLTEASSGRRHHLDGRPIHCGAFLELQALDFRDDDYGQYAVPLPQGLLVRYEARLHLPGAPATLHVLVAGRAFSAGLGQSHRFRWPSEGAR